MIDETHPVEYLYKIFTCRLIQDLYSIKHVLSTIVM